MFLLSPKEVFPPDLLKQARLSGREMEAYRRRGFETVRATAGA